jgi:serine/threonine protein kinase
MMPATRSSNDALGDRSLLPDRYELLEAPINEAGVWTCEVYDKHIRSDVLLRRSNSSDSYSLEASNPVLSEYRTLSHLRHAAIPDVVDLVFEPPVAWLVLESCRGFRTLATWSKGHWSLERLLLFLDGLLSALEYIHSMGYIHCNLTPRSVRAPADWDTELRDAPLRITGFHQAIHRDDCAESIMVPGSAFFNPNDQVGTFSPDWDLYSVGALAAYVLTDEFADEPREQPDARTLLNRSKNAIPAELLSLLLRMVGPEVSVRPQSAAEVRSELAAAFSSCLGVADPVLRRSDRRGVVPDRAVSCRFSSAGSARGSNSGLLDRFGGIREISSGISM